jgi:hypothetical protein
VAGSSLSYCHLSLWGGGGGACAGGLGGCFPFPGYLVRCADMRFILINAIYLTTQCLKLIFKKSVGIAVAWDRDESKGLLNAGMNLQVPQMQGIS